MQFEGRIDHRLTVLCAVVCLLLGLSSPALAQGAPDPLPPLPMDDETPPEAGTTATPAAESPPTEPNPAMPTPAVPDRTLACEEHFTGEPVAELAEKIDRVLSNKDLKGGKLSVLAVSYPEGKLLYGKEAQLKVNPASVTKLFTAATALAHFGPDHRWQTRVLATEEDCPELFLVGGGDPGLFEKDLQTLASQIKKAGITCASRLSYDVSAFDEAILPPHYEEKKSDAHWRPKIGAVGIADGALNIRIIPGTYPDAAPQVKVDPSNSCLLIDSRALTVETVEEGKELGVSVHKSGDQVVVKVTGQIPMKRSKGVLVRKAIPHPDGYAGCLFRDILRSKGIKVKSREVSSGVAPETAKTVAKINSNSLKSDLRRMQRWSKNFVAEQLVKLHADGRCTPMTFECGLRTMRQTLARFHLNHRCLQLENGSGLFDANRVSAAQVVRLLVEVANHKEWADLYRKALPLGGKSGTLKERMKKVKRPVRAKTGTLDYHSSLAGYIERRNGGYIVFAILMAETKTSAYRMRRIQDQVVEILARVK